MIPLEELRTPQQQIEAAMQDLKARFGDNMPTSTNRGRRKRKVKPYAQLSEQGRNLLRLLAEEERQMQSEASTATKLRNRGISWHTGQFAEQLSTVPASIARTLSNLEKRGLVFCTAEGEGKGRRVHYIRLTENARAIGIHQELYGMSHSQKRRQIRDERRWTRETYIHESYGKDTS